MSTRQENRNSIISCKGPLAVVPFQDRDILNLSKWLSADPNELFLTSSSLPYPCKPEDFKKYYQNNSKRGEHEFFSVADSQSREHVGHFEVKNIHSGFRNGTLAHVLIGNSNYRRCGLGKTLIDLMTRVCFEHLNLYRIALAVHVTNRTAVAAYIKGGFLVEGIIRDVISKGNQRYSLYQMSFLKPEWDPSI